MSKNDRIVFEDKQRRIGKNEQGLDPVNAKIKDVIEMRYTS